MRSSEIGSVAFQTESEDYDETVWEDMDIAGLGERGVWDVIM
jgi:hypothetical protein